MKELIEPRDYQLSLEQQFALQVAVDALKQMNREQIEEFARQHLRSIMVQTNIISKLTKIALLRIQD